MVAQVEEKPETAKGGHAKGGRYDAKIEQMRAQVARAEQRRDAANDELQVMRAEIALAQFSGALAILERANETPAESAQFGTPASQRWQLAIPPSGLLEYRHYPELRVQAEQYVYVTADPLQLAALRLAVEEQKIPGLEEMPIGMRCSFSKDGIFTGWFEPGVYDRLVLSGAGRGW